MTARDALDWAFVMFIAGGAAVLWLAVVVFVFGCIRDLGRRT